MAFGISAGAYLVAGAAVAGGAMAAGAAKSGAAAQAGAARDANATQLAQYNQTREDQAPWRDRGNAAGDRLSMLLGLDTPSVSINGTRTGIADSAENFDANAYLAAHPEVADATQWGGSAYDHYKQYGQGFGFEFTPTQEAVQGGQQNLQQLQAAKQDGTYGSLSRNFSAQDMNADPIYSQLAPGIQSSIQRSTDDLNKRGDFANSLLHQFGEADFQKDPGYDFRMREGQKSVENSAAARGMQLSGATLKAMQRFGQDFASNEYSKASDRFSNDRSFAANEYGNAFNRLSADRSFGADQMNGAYNRSTNDKANQYNRLAGVAGTGQQSNALVANAGMNMANQVGQNQLAMGNAQAASGIAQANAVNGAIGQGYNMYQGNQLMNMLGNRGASGTGSGGLGSGSYQWSGGSVSSNPDAYLG